MTNVNVADPWWQRYILAFVILLISLMAIALLAAVAIWNDKNNAMTIFNIALPVFASWVGTILAFYFGKENFESANTQIREIIKNLTPEEMAKNPIIEIMRKYCTDMVVFKIPEGKTDGDIRLSEFCNLFSDTVNRLPIINPDDSPKYIIHQSRIQAYLLSSAKNSDSDTLAKFIEDSKGSNIEFGYKKGFVIVSEKSTIAEAKLTMEQFSPSCQDIFITKGGTEKEPLLGWISNVRLSKYLQG